MHEENGADDLGGVLHELEAATGDMQPSNGEEQEGEGEIIDRRRERLLEHIMTTEEMAMWRMKENGENIGLIAMFYGMSEQAVSSIFNRVKQTLDRVDITRPLPPLIKPSERFGIQEADDTVYTTLAALAQSYQLDASKLRTLLSGSSDLRNLARRGLVGTSVRQLYPVTESVRILRLRGYLPKSAAHEHDAPISENTEALAYAA
ncbi:hypothetical protein A3B02_01730 [Candidatus Roizmanbacteria bacterium RIFCSPLOWO2_01_FULL_42_14]|uniref:Uncharacterized protein n=3 Tax=Candidatus Roizmaniibacteriota TaxID=1752723 RepID=A0A1F7J7H6_9BACT|nr:MAG: hypothetical protein A3D08_02735 [Candidatus Roizmanbacteria bacterium RIFCSPHIGHO2_02_FULL_43_11]OGK37894.1 MAG: hypothetical protein A3F32_01720 [Candidatus Roizmanbacteria bacterium RIFCSPHIGHO2_12_FULL_42_10]OGK51557.1 MAG: hypothetical protein A3B02_01730 [Candidatus Roizmanbacteria bacterium RIFCSPLOWO2_01_FULL_42_14]